MSLSGWGKWPCYKGSVVRPRNEKAVAQVLSKGSIIARGAGRSYGDSAVGSGVTMMTDHLNHFLDFDPQEGVLTCQAGVLLKDIVDFFVPRGFVVPVTPGTKFVTVGGMIAADVHGKNHHKAGSFGQYVQWFDLMLPGGEIRRCSASENVEYFTNTIGGMGLTGVVLRAAFKMMPIETAYMCQETLFNRDLDTTLAAFDASADWTYSVAWFDCLARGKNLGRSLLYRAEHAAIDDLSPGLATGPLELPKPRGFSVPFEFPSWSLNRWSVRAFNALYLHQGRKKIGKDLIDLDRYFYPLDAVENWNRIYGKAGFMQYQCVVPHQNSAAAIQELLSRISQSGQGSFLAVLKLLGHGKGGTLSFPSEGYTLALDFPRRKNTLALLEKLDQVVLAQGGHIYLAKDARLPAEAFQNSQPSLESFRVFRKEHGLEACFQSQQSRRLGL